LSQRTLLIAGLALIAAGLLLGGVAAPLLDGATPAATNGPSMPGGKVGPGYPGGGPDGGFNGRPGHRFPGRMTPSPAPGTTPNI
jgi:hypothetical protein